MKTIPFKDRAEWLSIRRGFIGGSEVAAIAGCHPYKTALEVWVVKTGQAEDVAGEAADIGRRMEPVIREMYTEKTGNRVVIPDCVYTEGIRLASLDGVVDLDTDEGVWECKHPGMRQLPRWEGDKTPDEILCQVNWYMGITGLKWCDLTALIGGDRWLVRRLEFDPELYGLLSQAVDRWWRDYIVGNKMPPATGQDLEVLGRLHHPVKEAIALPEDTNISIYNYNAVAEQIKRLEKEKDGIEAALKRQMLESAEATTSEFELRWTEYTQKRFDLDLFKAAHPAIYEALLKENKYKKFTIKRRKA